MSITACDTKVSMLLSLLLANVRIFSSFFFLFLVMLSNFLVIRVVRGKIRVKRALATPAGAQTILVNQMIDNPPLFSLKAIKTLSMQSKAATYLLNFLHMISFDYFPGKNNFHPHSFYLV